MAGTLPGYFINETKTNWPAAVGYLEERANPGDLVLFHNPDVLVPYRYYTQRDDLELHTVVAKETWQAAGVTDDRKPDVRPMTAGYQQVWLVSGYDAKTAITEREILKQLSTGFVPLEGREFSAIRVFRFVRNSNE